MLGVLIDISATSMLADLGTTSAIMFSDMKPLFVFLGGLLFSVGTLFILFVFIPLMWPSDKFKSGRFK